MDWQLVIAINVMMISFITVLFGILNRQQVDPSMLIVHGVVIATGALGLYFNYAQTGTIVTLIFVPLILVPGLLYHYATRAYLQARYPAAARYARWAAVIHPSRAMAFRSALMGALANDDIKATVAALQKLWAGGNALQRTSLEATAARLQGRWHEVLAIVRNPANDARGLQELEIRALGELGRTDEMVGVYERCKSQLSGMSLRNAQMFLLAFCGRPEAIALLRTAKSAPMHADFLAYWDAIATFNARGRRGEGRAMLETVAETSSIAAVRVAAQRYLADRGANGPSSPSAASLAVADALVAHWTESGTLQSRSLLRSRVTLLVLIVNAIMFALEHVYGGVEDPDALVKLGALWPPLVADEGEWWRLGAALFLHFGWAHFTMNMASLAILGRLVEAVYGRWRTAAIYGTGGLGSMATVLAMMTSGVSKADFVVGASGAIMALFGAWAARLLMRWRRSRDALDRQPAIFVAVIIAVQCAVDLSVPQISFTGHISGFIIGFLLGLAFGGGSMAGASEP